MDHGLAEARGGGDIDATDTDADSTSELFPEPAAFADTPDGWELEPYLMSLGQKAMDFILQRFDPKHVSEGRAAGGTQRARDKLRAVHKDEDEPRSIIYSEPAISALLKVPPKTIEGPGTNVSLFLSPLCRMRAC